MIGFHTLYQRDSLTKYGYIAFYDTFHVLAYGKLTALGFLSQVQIRIYTGGLFDTLVNSQSLVLLTVLRVFHSLSILS